MRSRRRNGKLVTLLVLVGLGARLWWAYVLMTSPSTPARHFCTAWKAGDSHAMAAVSSRSTGTAKIKTAAGSFDIPDLARQVKFSTLRVTGHAVVSDDIATVPAVAQIDGLPTAHALASQIPVPVEPPLLDALARALNKPFHFTIGLVKQNGRWKVDQQATFTSLGDALQQDPAVKRAGLAIFRSAFSSLMGERSTGQRAA
ncbi:MAG: hypothetical protein LC772_04555 [Chloroflexi bacterium]|nr:hypothetical protein [Chloroflexota bacterium]